MECWTRNKRKLGDRPRTMLESTKQQFARCPEWLVGSSQFQVLGRMLILPTSVPKKLCPGGKWLHFHWFVITFSILKACLGLGVGDDSTSEVCASSETWFGSSESMHKSQMWCQAFVTPVRERLRQADLWGSMVSQHGLIGKYQASARSCLETRWAATELFSSPSTYHLSYSQFLPRSQRPHSRLPGCPSSSPHPWKPRDAHTFANFPIS